MRKLVFLPILLCSVFSFYNSAMAGTCGAQYIDFDGLQDADDDEFIYQFYGVYTEANSNKDCEDGCTLKKVMFGNVIINSVQQASCCSPIHLYIHGKGNSNPKRRYLNVIQVVKINGKKWGMFYHVQTFLPANSRKQQ